MIKVYPVPYAGPVASVSAAPRLRRRTLLSAAAVVGGLAGCGVGRAEPIRRWVGTPGSSGVFIRWFGANAWEIHFGTRTILVDPWFVRFSAGAYDAGGIRPDTPLPSTDPARIDPYVRRVNLILVCQGHYDNIADIPYIAARTGARVLGTGSHCNTLRAMGVPADQLVEVGADRRLDYDNFTVDVYGAPAATAHDPFPGSHDTVPPPPRTVGDLVAGGTLVYQLTIKNQFRVLVLGAPAFDATALAGVRPDLVIVPVDTTTGAAYVGPLMRTLDHPTWVLPTGWDDVDRPLTEPARDRGALGPLREALAAASPATSFVKLDHLQVFTP
jgi:L-ascorbate metabolism protein UlaG (beta-lactamase superfamily)